MSQGFGGLFEGNNWVWIVLILIFVLPKFGSGFGTGGLFGGSNLILILLILIFVLPSLGIGFDQGFLSNCFGNLGNLLGNGCQE